MIWSESKKGEKMIEVEINEDVRKYKPKFIGPFTTRQVICLVLGGGSVIFTYQFLHPFLTSDITTFLCMLISIPFMAVGWIEPYGMKMEDFARTTVISLILAPNVRKYKVENSYNAKLLSERNKKKKKRKRSKGKIKLIA